MFRVMIVDDQEDMRRMFRKILESEADFQIVLEAADGSEAVNLIDGHRLDMVLMDVQMPEMDGFEATRLILAHRPELSITLTSMNSDKEYSRLARESGAVGFIPKPTLSSNALRQVIAGRIEHHKQEGASQPDSIGT